MRLLSFDIECAKVHQNYSPICNFGYVIYDEDFNLVEKNDFIINPKSKFNLEGRKNQEDIKLFYSKNDYKKAKPFNYYYNEIKELLEYDDQIILNHAVINDIIYLKNDCLRYKLPIINFVAYDTMEVYRALLNFNGSLSLEKVVNQLYGDKSFIFHKADEDANAAMSVFIQSCKMLNINSKEMIYLANINEYKSNINTYKKEKKSTNINTYKNITKDVIIISNFFINKKISISKAIEKDKEKFEQVLYTVKQLSGEFTLKVSEADVFIFDKLNHCKRCDSYIYNLELGKIIKGYDYDEYIKVVNKILTDNIVGTFNALI